MNADPAAVAKPSDPGWRVTQVGVFRSEWTKLRSLRSTGWTLAATALLTVAIGILASAVVASHWGTTSVSDKVKFEPVSTSLLGIEFGILSMGVLGVLAISAEYSTGMARSTFAAVPRRLPVLWGKVGVFAVVALALSVPATLIAFFIGQAFLSSEHLDVAFSDPGVARAVLGGAVYLSAAGLLGLGLGAILRNTAGAISSFVAIMFVIPPLLGILPSGVSDAIEPYLPNKAGQAIVVIGSKAHTLSPWAGLAVFIGWVAIGIAAGAVLLVRRDV